MEEYSKALNWLCLAANQSYGKAQYQMAYSHAYGRQVTGGEPDYVQAHMWYELAASDGMKYAELRKEHFAQFMTPGQIAEAKRLALEWQPGDCEPEVSGSTAEN